MATEFEARCRGPQCGKRIVMRPDDRGRPHPYDPAKRCARCKGAGELTQTAVELFGERTLRTPCPACRGKGEVWVSHFKTCPDADVFRGKAEAAE